VDDAVAAVLAANFGLLAVPVALVQLLGQELEEFMRVLFFRGHQILKGFFLRDPEPGQDVGCGVAIRVLQGIEILKHVVHGAAEAVRDVAVVALVPVAEVKVAQQRVVEEALEDNVLVASSASVVDATKTVGPA
jgi:hypothetical protein